MSSTDSLVASNNAFALALYQQLRGADGNLAFSPASVSVALGMACAGARGETAAQMQRALHLGTDCRAAAPAYGALLRSWTSDASHSYELSVANRLWGDRAAHFVPDYLALTRDAFHAPLAQVDFRHAAEPARAEINRWVAGQTHDKITDLLPMGAVDRETNLVLTNAIYFKGTWQHVFQTASTSNAPFRVSASRRVDVPMMRQTHQFGFAAVQDAQVLELPYAGGALVMDVILPNRPDGLGWLEGQLNEDNLRRWVAGVQPQQVSVALPRFRVTSRAAMKTALTAMGMSLPFQPGADFGAMSPDPRTHIDDVFHQAYVDVNEQGTEAAAATAVVMTVRGMVMPAHTFTADHPFVFAIRDARNGSVLFLGRVSDPSAR